ncbi:MAG TPA: sugar transferase [Terriglobales bacterium]|jgi:sugar transferase EpsL|nr:sugar transferase [Terriglobales bacterium]
MGRRRIPRWKRSFDLFIAVIALLVTVPAMLVIALCVRASVGSPVLFRQRRPGLGGRPFTIYKFRTMRLGEASIDTVDQQRITRFGGFLRRTGLDELPQLWNVLRGDMSVVGPRPLLMEYLDRYSPQQSRRHLVLPGIIGWAQVNGRNAVSWEQRFSRDLWYVDHQSFGFDLKILCLAVIRVLKRNGITQSGHTMMPEFRGSVRSANRGR